MFLLTSSPKKFIINVFWEKPKKISYFFLIAVKGGSVEGVKAIPLREKYFNFFFPTAIKLEGLKALMEMLLKK